VTTTTAVDQDRPEQRPADPEPRPGVILVVALLLGGLLTAGWFLASGRSQQPPAPAEPLSPREQLEAVLAQEPDNLPARRRLGDLHFAEDRFDQALAQYLVVLEAEPRDPLALARSGWIAFEGGDTDTAERLVSEALDVRPGDPEALWYLAQIRLYGGEDPAGAVLPLRTLLERDDLAPDLRRQARRLLRDAR
jgi:cytochrome c-type biogenesis protein CcmH/NrfG